MVLIISDSHRLQSKVLELIEQYHPDRIFDLGDSEAEIEFLEQNNIVSVKGNCDFIHLPERRIINYKGINILMTHGHLHYVRNGLLNLKYLAEENDCQYVFYGHTHIQKLETMGGILFLNPGALISGHYALMDDKGEITLY